MPYYGSPIDNSGCGRWPGSRSPQRTCSAERQPRRSEQRSRDSLAQKGERTRETQKDRRHKLGGLAAGLVVAALCGVLPAAAAASGVSYVAMGDSYTSAPGVLPYVPTAPPYCARSELNYPHLVASALKLSLTDVSCGGAKTEDLTISQLPGQPPQFEALSKSTEVVSLGIGGDNRNLNHTVIAGCTQIALTEPGKGTCESKYEGFVTKTFKEDQAPYEAALAKIHKLSPKAKVFVVGYPDIAPAHGSCPTAIPWSEGDLKWYRNQVERRGNADIKRWAKARGAIFVNTFGPSEGHDICQPVGTRWIEPLFGSLTGVPLHPNALGEENLAVELERAMLNHGVR